MPKRKSLPPYQQGGLSDDCSGGKWVYTRGMEGEALRLELLHDERIRELVGLGVRCAMLFRRSCAWLFVVDA